MPLQRSDSLAGVLAKGFVRAASSHGVGAVHLSNCPVFLLCVLQR
jgi:hypothetical protein